MHNLKRYVKFIYACIERNKTFIGYTEEHHILPKSKEFWPEYINLRSHVWNKANLTGHQHFIAHMMLAIALGGGMWGGAHMMTVINDAHDRGYKVTGRQYEMIKTQMAINTSKRLKGVALSADHRNRIGEGVKKSVTEERRKAISKRMRGECNPRFGAEMSSETKQKISEANTGRLIGANNPMFGKTHSDDALVKISNAAKGRIVTDDQKASVSAKMKLVKANEPDHVCPHCGTVGRSPSVFRYHFDRCKLKPDNAK